MAGKDEEDPRPGEDSPNIGGEPQNDDDFNLFRNRRVLYPTAIGIMIVVGILLFPFFF